jgi:hypothetical protein
VPEMTLLGDGDKEPEMPDKIHVTTVTRCSVRATR